LHVQAEACAGQEPLLCLLLQFRALPIPVVPLPVFPFQGRMARIIIEIKNPLSGASPMLLNSYVRVRIDGSMIKDSYSIKRDYMNEGNNLWFIRPDKTLKILHIDPIWSDRNTVIFKTNDITEGDQLIISDLAITIEGTELRIINAKPERKASKEPTIEK